MKGIIIDGVAGSGKSLILNYIHGEIHKKYPSSTKFFISEHYTERMLEHLRDKKELNGLHIKNHISQIIESLQTYHQMLEESKFSQNPRGADTFVTLERFLLTHFASMDIESEYSVDEANSHFNTLNKLGIRQIVLVVPESRLKESILSTLNYRNERWKEHLFSRGTEKDIIAHYSNWQNKFLSYVNKFKDHIETKIIEVQSNNYQKYGNLIIDSYFKE